MLWATSLFKRYSRVHGLSTGTHVREVPPNYISDATRHCQLDSVAPAGPTEVKADYTSTSPDSDMQLGLNNHVLAEALSLTAWYTTRRVAATDHRTTRQLYFRTFC